MERKRYWVAMHRKSICTRFNDHHIFTSILFFDNKQFLWRNAAEQSRRYDEDLLIEFKLPSSIN
jgi:hypothetical protein